MSVADVTRLDAGRRDDADRQSTLSQSLSLRGRAQAAPRGGSSMTDTPPTPAAAPPALVCHASGCEAAAILVYRLVPHSHGPEGARSVWDTVATDVPACSRHLEAARSRGSVISARPLSDAISTRVVAD